MALSLDLRERVVAAVDAGGSVRTTAGRFGVAARTVQNWLALRRQTGALAPRPHRGGRPGPPPELLTRLARLLAGESGLSLSELSSRTARPVGVVRRALRRMNDSRKKRPSGPPSRTART
jgi:transposase